MLIQRVATAVVLIALVLVLLFYLPPIGFQAAVVIVMSLASWEWATMVGVKTFHNKAILILISWAVLYVAHLDPFVSLWVAMVWWFLAFAKLHTYPRGKDYWRHNIFILTGMSIPVLVPFALGLMVLREQPHGIWQVLYVMIMVWAADTGGYAAGKLWGTWKIAPSLSPKKSYQGFAGSLLAALIVAAVAAWQIHLARDEYFIWFGFAALITLFALMGDLFESMIKRAMDVKDSGTLLPGHGGLLDRIDALTAAVPLFALFSLMHGVHFL